MEPTILKTPRIYKGAGIYKIGEEGGGGGGGDLPEGYTKCNYIESRGNAYITRYYQTTMSDSSGSWNIKFSPNNETTEYFRFLATARYNNSTNNGQSIGIVNINNPAFSVAAYNVTEQIILSDKPPYIDASIIWPLNGVGRKFETNFGERSFANGWTRTDYIWIFGFPASGAIPAQYAKGAIYRITYKKNDSVILDLIPVKKNDTSEYGFLDIVNNNFWGATAGTLYGA